MSITTLGIVTNGVVVPNSPLPEGAHVEIHLSDSQEEMPEELRQELAAWQQGSAEAIDLVERLAATDDPNEAR
jgi:hypothetical protein